MTRSVARWHAQRSYALTLLGDNPRGVGYLLKQRLAGLTPRQREVLGLVAEGRSNVAIGERLCITEKAVVQHISNIYEALGLAAQPEDHRRVLAVLRYLA